MDTAMIESIVRGILQPVLEGPRGPLPVAISNRHAHLSAEHVETLFGRGYELKVLKELSQPGQFAYRETVTLVGPGGVLEKVRVLGPPRSSTQVEISRTDGFRLGLKPPVRDSGDVKGSTGAAIVGPVGSVTIPEGVIVARRHIHMRHEDALRLKVSDREIVRVSAGGERGVTFGGVLVRVSDAFSLEMHIDVDEGNAAGISNGDPVYIV